MSSTWMYGILVEEIDLQYIGTNENVAYIFTKAVDLDKLQ